MRLQKSFFAVSESVTAVSSQQKQRVMDLVYCRTTQVPTFCSRASNIKTGNIKLLPDEKGEAYEMV